MKRIFCLLLCLLLLCSLTGCHNTGRGQSGQTQGLVAVTAAPTEAAASTPTAAPETAVPSESTASTPTAAPETAVPSESTASTPTAAPETAVPSEASGNPGSRLTEDGVYDSKDEVALYIHLFGHLPSNYITKKQAEELGWSGGSLEPYAPGKCIGGSRFGNYEGLLPDARGRSWTECDIDTMGARSRGAKRIVFSNDGLIYYTGDHYNHFELLYGQED